MAYSRYSIIKMGAKAENELRWANCAQEVTMGLKEAIKNKIKFTDVPGGGIVYFPKCHLCGNEVQAKSYNEKRQYTCNRCKGITKELKNEERVYKKEIRFARALDRLEDMVGDLTPYERAINLVKVNLHRPGWFASTEEILMAFELIKNKVKVIHNQKIKRYRADFVLPDLKIVLEVDGEKYHNSSTREREGVRDGEIILMLGLDWRIVRVPTAYINKDVRKTMLLLKR